MNRAKNLLKCYLIITGIAANASILYLAAGGPIFIDRWLDMSRPPAKAQFIICPTGGLTGNNLPTDEGWECIYTAVQLYFDGLGKKIIFTGGGVEKISEAEVYAEAAGWLGCPDEATGFEPGAVSTADHPRRLLQAHRLGINKETSLDIVSSELHSRRLALCFRKAGFNNFHMVSTYVAQKQQPSVVRQLLVSRFHSYEPNGKSYGDVFNRLRWRSDRLFYALREIAALASYKLKGNL